MLQERCEIAVSLETKAIGQCGPTLITCGRRELIPAGECGAILVQEFQVCIPVAVTVMAECPDTSEVWYTDCTFTIEKRVVVEIPLHFDTEVDGEPAGPSLASGRCRSMVAATLAASLPLEFTVDAACNLSQVHC